MLGVSNQGSATTSLVRVTPPATKKPSEKSPVELLEMIFTYNLPKELGKIACVCRAWRSVLKDDPSFSFPIARNKTLFSKGVEEISLRKFPRELVLILSSNNIRPSKLPREEMENPIGNMTRLSIHGARAPVTIIVSNNEEHPGEKMVFRAIGQADSLERIFIG